MSFRFRHFSSHFVSDRLRLSSESDADPVEDAGGKRLNQNKVDTFSIFIDAKYENLLFFDDSCILHGKTANECKKKLSN